MDQTFLLHLKPWEQRLSYQITQVLPAEKVFVLATSLFIEHTESIFSPSRIITRDDELVYVLLLFPSLPTQSVPAMASSLEKACGKPVLPLVMTFEDFNQGLVSGDFFCCYTLKNARLIHDGGTAFSAPASVDGNALHQQLEKTYKEALQHMDDLLTRSATGEHHKSVLLLRAAIVHALQMILFMGMVFPFTSTRIEELLVYCGMVAPEPAVIFARYTDKERQRFASLEQLGEEAAASIPADHSCIDWMTEKAKALQEVLVKYGKERLTAIAAPGQQS